jgi:hypothetical protein
MLHAMQERADPGRHALWAQEGEEVLTAVFIDQILPTCAERAVLQEPGLHAGMACPCMLWV